MNLNIALNLHSYEENQGFVLEFIKKCITCCSLNHKIRDIFDHTSCTCASHIPEHYYLIFSWNNNFFLIPTLSKKGIQSYQVVSEKRHGHCLCNPQYKKIRTLVFCKTFYFYNHTQDFNSLHFVFHERCDFSLVLRLKSNIGVAEKSNKEFKMPTRISSFVLLLYI